MMSAQADAGWAWTENTCVCGGPSVSALCVARDFNMGATDRQSVILACRECGGLHPAIFPDADARPAAYRDYYTGARPARFWRSWPRQIADATRRGYLDRQTPAAARRVLDYGCGAGAYLARMTRRNPAPACAGTDALKPDDNGQAFAWLSASEVLAARPFDWITLGHVVEHLDDPAAAVRLLADKLLLDGGLWIATPNAASFIIASAGPWARDIDFPRHRQIFSRKGLEQLLAGAGLSARFLPAPRLNALLNVASTLGNIAGDRSASRRDRAAAALTTIVRLLAHLASPASRRSINAPELVAVCAREDMAAAIRRGG